MSDDNDSNCSATSSYSTSTFIASESQSFGIKIFCHEFFAKSASNTQSAYLFNNEFFASISFQHSVNSTSKHLFTSPSQLSISRHSAFANIMSFNIMNVQKLRFCSCSSLDVKNAEIERYYMSEIDLFSSDLNINNETSASDLIYFRNYRIFRNVKLFIQRIKQIKAKDDVSIQWILSFCLYEAAFR